jgi:hypothetical protein
VRAADAGAAANSECADAAARITEEYAAASASPAASFSCARPAVASTLRSTTTSRCSSAARAEAAIRSASDVRVDKPTLSRIWREEGGRSVGRNLRASARTGALQKAAKGERRI